MDNMDSAASAALLAITHVPQNLNAEAELKELEGMKAQAAAGHQVALQTLADKNEQRAERRRQMSALNSEFSEGSKALADFEFSAQQEIIENPAADRRELANQVRLRRDALALVSGAVGWVTECGMQDAIDAVLEAAYNLRKIESAQAQIEFVLSDLNDQILLKNAYQVSGKISFVSEKTERYRAIAEGAALAEQGARKELGEFRAHRERLAQQKGAVGYIGRAQVKNTI